jgi:tryptophan synthase alpha chain
MQPIDQVFQQKEGQRLIPFVVAGDPTPQVTLDLLHLLQEEGASVVELGVPYSDPLADGPLIQEASERALRQGMNLTKVLELARTAREQGITLPLVLFTYYNPILQFGPERLVKEARAAGINGMIIPDLPWEEGKELTDLAAQQGIYLIPLVAPTSKERIRKIVRGARGFVYCVSSLGTTGIRQNFAQGVEEFLETVRQESPVPTAVGFGISAGSHVEYFLRHADAAVVGSALVREIALHQEALQDKEKRAAALESIRGFVRGLIPAAPVKS